MEKALDALLTRADWRKLPPEQAIDDTPVATHETIIVIGEWVVRAYQLSDGRRVVEPDDVLNLLNFYVPFEDPEWKGEN